MGELPRQPEKMAGSALIEQADGEQRLATAVPPDVLALERFRLISACDDPCVEGCRAIGKLLQAGTARMGYSSRTVQRWERGLAPAIWRERDLGRAPHWLVNSATL